MNYFTDDGVRMRQHLDNYILSNERAIIRTGKPKVGSALRYWCRQQVNSDFR